MFTELRVRHFKRFNDAKFSFTPCGVTLLAGDNNSGKSTLIQAIALWQFCVQEFTRQLGNQHLLKGAQPGMLSVALSNFRPLSLPDFRYLWFSQRTNAKIELSCSWALSPNDKKSIRRLAFRLLYAPGGVHIVRRYSNLAGGEKIPKAAFLPAFAGIRATEMSLSNDARERLIGEGLAGAVLRNVLRDMHDAYSTGIAKSKGKARATFRRNHPWWRLNDILRQVFDVGLLISAPANQPIRANVQEVTLDKKGMPRRAPRAKARDIMIEGAGFLQWLSVYTLAVQPDVDVLLLDEPDAHLHKDLQDELVFRVRNLAGDRRQVILATHSMEILGDAECSSIYWLEKSQHGYLKDDEHRRKLFLGLGGLYAPKIQSLKKHKKLLMVEGPGDVNILRALSMKLKGSWPNDVVVWHYKENDLEKSKYGRRQLFTELRDEIEGLKGLSLEDRDDKMHYKNVPSDLAHAGKPKDGLALRMWRRRNIENYLLLPAAIARAATRPEQEIKDFLMSHHGFAVAGPFGAHDCHPSMALIDGKQILTTRPDSICAQYGITAAKIAEQMNAGEIPEDIKALVDDLHDIWPTL